MPVNKDPKSTDRPIGFDQWQRELEKNKQTNIRNKALKEIEELQSLLGNIQDIDALDSAGLDRYYQAQTESLQNQLADNPVAQAVTKYQKQKADFIQLGYERPSDQTYYQQYRQKQQKYYDYKHKRWYQQGFQGYYIQKGQVQAQQIIRGKIPMLRIDHPSFQAIGGGFITDRNDNRPFA